MPQAGLVVACKISKISKRGEKPRVATGNNLAAVIAGGVEFTNGDEPGVKLAKAKGVEEISRPNRRA